MLDGPLNFSRNKGGKKETKTFKRLRGKVILSSALLNIFVLLRTQKEKNMYLQQVLWKQMAGSVSS